MIKCRNCQWSHLGKEAKQVLPRTSKSVYSLILCRPFGLHVQSSVDIHCKVPRGKMRYPNALFGRRPALAVRCVRCDNHNYNWNPGCEVGMLHSNWSSGSELEMFTNLILFPILQAAANCTADKNTHFCRYHLFFNGSVHNWIWNWILFHTSDRPYFVGYCNINLAN